MSFENPTPLRLGMAGTFAGKRYRIVGRVVMGMDDEGETYYWNEFNLKSDDGENITLVHEPTEDGEAWRLFTLFEPDNPMSVQEAASIRVGDEVNLEGNPIRVTLMDESQVYYIEGEAPEGVEVGDVANYFNAETDNKMQVVSWTGNEIEFYRGANLHPETVAAAFNTHIEPCRKVSSATSLLGSMGSQFEGSDDSASPWVIKVVVGLLALVIMFVWFSTRGSLWRRTSVVRSSAPASPLSVGNAGSLEGTTFHVGAHAVVAIQEVGRYFERHEYLLVDTNGKPALLVYGLKPGGKDWCLFSALQPTDAFTPQKAAAVRYGELVNIDGIVAPATELFQTTVLGTDVENPTAPVLRTGERLFGFAANANGMQLLVRWNESGIAFHHGSILPEKTVTQAFSQTARK
jgi:hypothetical protein